MGCKAELDRDKASLIFLKSSFSLRTKIVYLVMGVVLSIVVVAIQLEADIFLIEYSAPAISFVMSASGCDYVDYLCTIF